MPSGQFRASHTPRSNIRWAGGGSGSAQNSLNKRCCQSRVRPSLTLVGGARHTCVGCEDLRENILIVDTTSFRRGTSHKERKQLGEGRAIAEVGNNEEKNHAAKVPVCLSGMQWLQAGSAGKGKMPAIRCGNFAITGE